MTSRNKLEFLSIRKRHALAHAVAALIWARRVTLIWLRPGVLILDVLLEVALGLLIAHDVVKRLPTFGADILASPPVIFHLSNQTRFTRHLNCRI